jgi:hypothetical protein
MTERGRIEREMELRKKIRECHTQKIDLFEAHAQN